MAISKTMIATGLILATGAVAKAAPSCTSIAERLRTTPELSELKALMDGFGTEIREDGSRKLTILAPTNSAIQALSPEQVAGFQQDPASFTKVIADHVVVGDTYKAQDLVASDGKKLPTVAGTSLTVEVAAGEVMIQGPHKGSIVTVTTPDVPACDAIIHLVDAVILEGAKEAPKAARSGVAHTFGTYGEEADGLYGAYGSDGGQELGDDSAEEDDVADLAGGAERGSNEQRDATVINGRSSPSADTSSAGAIVAGAVAAVMVAGLAGVVAVVVVKRQAAAAAAAAALSGSTI